MIKNPRIELFGSVDDPEISRRVTRLEKYGYTVFVKRREDHANLASRPCGKFYCNCPTVCLKELETKPTPL